MCSPKMRAANRRNALKSTGPKTPQGKARSSQNAISHRLSARATVVLDESVEEFDAFAQGIRDDLRPAGPMEIVLVDRIVHLSWKLRRIPKVEAELFVRPDPSIEGMLDPDHADRIAHVMVMDLRNDDSTMRRVQEYEARMDRALQATLRELKRLRAMKRESRSDDDVRDGNVQDGNDGNMQAEACTPAEEVMQPVDQPRVANPENEAVLNESGTWVPINPRTRSDPAPTDATPRCVRAS